MVLTTSYDVIQLKKQKFYIILMTWRHRMSVYSKERGSNFD